jgi:hypothetical protein
LPLLSLPVESLTGGFLVLHSAFAGCSAFGRGFSSVLLGMNAQVVP